MTEIRKLASLPVFPLCCYDAVEKITNIILLDSDKNVPFCLY